MIVTLAVAVSMLPAAPANAAWGKAVDGIRLGIVAGQSGDGPPTISCYLENVGDRRMILIADGIMAPPVPSCSLLTHGRAPGMNGPWRMTPSSVQISAVDGPCWQRVLQPHQFFRYFSSRGWFPIVPGSYKLSATQTIQIQPFQPGQPLKTGRNKVLQSGDTSITIRPEDTLPNRPDENSGD